MIVIGVRASTDHIRYAVMELDQSGSAVWINKNAPHEHRWLVPRAADTKAKKLLEVHREFLRLIDKYKPAHVVIKTSENVPGGASSDRVSIEAIVNLASGERNVTVSERVYSQLKPDKATRINSGNVREHVLTQVDKPTSHWDAELADALVAALRVLGK